MKFINKSNENNEWVLNGGDIVTEKCGERLGLIICDNGFYNVAMLDNNLETYFTFFNKGMFEISKKERISNIQSNFSLVKKSDDVILGVK